MSRLQVVEASKDDNAFQNLLSQTYEAVGKCWNMRGASEFKLSSQQQSRLSMQWSHHQNSRGIEQTFALIINQPLAAQLSQIAHTGHSLALLCAVCISPPVALPPFILLPTLPLSLYLSLSLAHIPAARYFGSSKVNLHWVNNHPHRRCSSDQKSAMFFFFSFETNCLKMNTLSHIWHLSETFVVYTADCVYIKTAWCQSR